MSERRLNLRLHAPPPPIEERDAELPDSFHVPSRTGRRPFAAELTRWRLERGLSKKQLAAEMGFDPSYVSHVEGRRHRPTEDFARRAEAVLGAGGAMWQRFREYDELRHARPAGQAPPRDPPVPEQWLPPGTGLVVEQEEASLRYDDGRVPVRDPAGLYNAGARAGHPIPRADRRRPVPERPGRAPTGTTATTR